VPYHVHNRENEPASGRQYSTASEAGQSKQDGEIVTFLASTDEINAWRDREYTRKLREYIAAPFFQLIEDRYPDHYLHLSMTQAGKLAYTKSVQHGIEDRQTIVRAGKYLTEYYADLGPETIAKYAGMVSAESVDLKIARSPDEILTAYTADLGSCMRAGKDCLQRLPQHPVRAYGNSDLAVAYTGPIDNVKARCIVWPDKMIYNRPYGHTSMIEPLLRSAGYTQGRIEGARIRAIAYRDGWIVPYVDGVSRGTLSSDRQWIILDDTGPIDLHNTSGIAADEDHGTCTHCNEPCDPDQGLCDYCDENTSTCEACGDRTNFDDLNGVNDSYYCESCYRDRFFSCAACHDDHDNDESHEGPDGRDYCQECFGDRFTTCDSCQGAVPCDETRSSEASGEYYCDSCWSGEDRTCAMADCETEWNELDRFDYSARERRRKNHTGDICQECADRFCFTCECTHDPDDCQVLADAESDGFGVAGHDPAGTPWQGGLRFDVAPPAIVQVPGLPIGYTCDWRHYGTIGAREIPDPGPCYDRHSQSLLMVVNDLDGLAPRSWRHIFTDMQ
jgi:hypothetical protein